MICCDGFVHDTKIVECYCNSGPSCTPIAPDKPVLITPPSNALSTPGTREVALLHGDGENNGTMFPDVTGKTWTSFGNTITSTSSPQSGTASIFFPGSSDTLSSQTSSDFNFGTDPFTIDFWMKTSKITGYGGILQHNAYYTAANSWLIFQNGANLDFWMGGSRVLYTTSTWGDGNWHHITITRVGNNLNMLIDGVVKSSYSNPSVGTYSFGSSNVGLLMGLQNGTTGRDFLGYIDELHITSQPSAELVPIQVRVGESLGVSWNAIANWGIGCPENVNGYKILVTDGATVISDTPVASDITAGSWTPDGTGAGKDLMLKVASTNGGLSTNSDERLICVERGAVLSGVCDEEHKAGCTEDCGTDDCAALTTGNDCVATITGTLFDVSGVESCGEMASAPKFANQSFGIFPAVADKWPIINPPAMTNNDGVYSEQVYAPATYTIDFSDFLSSGLVSGVKLVCSSYQANVTSNGQTVVNNFGFWRIYGGWWQVVGGNVYAQNGVTSVIPGNLTPTENQRLILPDANGRYGLLSYGVPWTGMELGGNPNAMVSDVLWRIESPYESLRYDYDFYKTRVDIFPYTKWNGDEVVYDDYDLNGYQIFKYTGDVNLDYSGPVGEEKVILLVDGNVNIYSNITVPVGAFLSIIAKGDINIDPAVTKAQGWFVAENINIPCKETAGTCDKTDVQFAGEGSFVGYTSINLGRNQGDVNNTKPSELFTYRPDFLVNIPTPMKVYTKKYSPFIP